MTIESPPRKRIRGRDTFRMIEAAKAADADSVVFPDGTIIRLKPAATPPTVPDDDIKNLL